MVARLAEVCTATTPEVPDETISKLIARCCSCLEVKLVALAIPPIGPVLAHSIATATDDPCCSNVTPELPASPPFTNAL